MRQNPALALLMLGAACTAAAPPGPHPGPHVIVLSIDSFNEARFRAAAGPEVAPALHAYFASAACAATARPAFPSKTAPGHASLWTGAYGNVNGIVENTQPALPMSEHTILDRVSGFSNAGLRAEPMWITAGLAGLRVAGHHATQSPDAPGYPEVDPAAATDADALAHLRARADSALARSSVTLLNGYNDPLTSDLLLDERSAPPHAARPWKGLPAAVTTAAREAAVPLGRAGDSLFVLFVRGSGGFDHALVAGSRDAARAATVRPAPADTTWPATRPLARFFSKPIPLSVAGHPLVLSVRLFALASDLSDFALFVPALSGVDANHAGAGAEYLRAIGGWTENTASGLYQRGALGRRIDQGGDGSAEAWWAESAEYLTRQQIRGAAWLWRTRTPQLLIDYMPVIDDVDHVLYGFVDRHSPRFSAGQAARYEQVRQRMYAIVDRKVASLQALASGAEDAFFLVSDHGMRATWRVFRPNVVLARAGLLALDSAGRIDLSRTRALSPSGYLVKVNRVAWKGGIVKSGEEREVVDLAARALLDYRDADGDPVVTHLWRPDGEDSLGIGGPVGGDLYYEVAPGYALDGRTVGSAIAAEPNGGASNHGFPSVARDMQAVLCANGRVFRPGHYSPARTIDLAPTVDAYFGISPAPTVRGRSLLKEWMTGER